MEKPNYNKKPKTLPKYVDKEVIMNILDKAKKDRYRNYIMLLCLWRTGMRVSEIVKLQKQDIKENNIVVRQGKGKKDRVIPLESELSNLLGLFSDSLKPRDILFPLSTRQVRNIVYKYSPWYEEMIKGKKIKRFEVHPHTFRHSFAVYCLKSGMNVMSVQAILGHSDLNTTKTYLELVGKHVKEDFDKVEW